MAEKKEKQVTFEESLNTSETFFLKNRKMIFGILGAVIVLVVGGILYHSYVSLPREDEASTELAKSEQLMMPPGPGRWPLPHHPSASPAVRAGCCRVPPRHVA